MPAWGQDQSSARQKRISGRVSAGFGSWARLLHALAKINRSTQAAANQYLRSRNEFDLLKRSSMVAFHALKLCGAAEDISDLAQESAKCVKLCQTGLSRQKADRLSITKPDRYLGAFAELAAGRI